MEGCFFSAKYLYLYLGFITLISILNENLVNSQYTGGSARARNRQGTINRGYVPIKPHPCEQSSCYPATGNLLIGREKQLHASSTCGLHEQQRYCIVSHLEEKKKCFWCDSRPNRPFKMKSNHSIQNIVYRYYPGTKEKSWWQSENGKENVSIQLDLEAEFHFTHLIITFKTFRPAAMLIERSYDFGKTWKVYRYFAVNCAESFPGIPEKASPSLTDVVCESRYSNVAPSSEGELIFRVLPPNFRIDNPYSEEIQSLLKMTNLRINFTKLHTLGDDLLDKREEIQEKYYYAIIDMVVRGSCSCYGHANRCLPLYPNTETKPDMVHGRCECTHNTKGSNCEECEDFFNDLPWRPAIGKQTNACKRCNCNNHATSCHFDPAVYEKTGRISGGVCDGCRHNTMGTNCEQCKPFFYKDPLRDIQDPEVCRPCDCDPIGSTDGGACDSTTDPINGLEAGKCHCKTNVEGRRCDNCKNGFWNFSAENPDGCQQCTCDTLGTIGNQGCNVYSGECTCKRYVTGRNCNQCLPEYWGLSDKRDGCQPCDCDPGGSYDNNCDVITGLCKCREHMTGRQCNIPQQQHFTASLDFLLYEAELAKGSSTCQVVIREPFRDGRPTTWSGTGFMKAPEGSFIEFYPDNIKTSLDYDISIRYESILPDYWNDATVTIIRPALIDPQGPCASTHRSDDIKKVNFPSGSRSVLVYPPTCLEAGQTYKIRLDFNNYKYGTSTPSASILIDSIVLIPRIDKLPWFQGSSPPAEARRKEFEELRCDEALRNPNQPLSEVCKQYYSSIGAYVFNGAFSCQCDPTGSVSKICGEYGGACICKPNVVGRKCDRCAPGTYGFGPEGCKACDCNNIGALDNFCNITTGQCKCRANTYGRECDQCRIGFWNFPNCQRCDCNGHADICDSKTGVCTECRDHTEGHHCDYCNEGYYGDPRIGFDIPCRTCPCPGSKDQFHSFADRCSLDPQTKDVVCECKEGYAGSKCDICAENYHGNPEVPGGSCKLCECNGKINSLVAGNCDPHTGKCFQCLYETAGDHCEFCKDGFFRQTTDDYCQPCTCQILGTNETAGPCDRESGQCQCLPNVIGKNCDRCEKNHWKIASGKGCEPCDCDPVGSIDPQCNEFEGQCMCKENFGGRQCNECRENYWGNPKQNECIECRCNPEGSETSQCNRKTGYCVCRKGIGGKSCDECARGYLGTAPYCSPCGECFDNWNRILIEHRNKTLDIIERAKNIKKIGATGAYTNEFDKMQNQLDEIDQLLKSTTSVDVDQIKNNLNALDKRLKAVKDDSLDVSLNNITQGIKLSEIKLNDLKKDVEKLIAQTEELQNNGTALQEADVHGALDLIQQAKTKAATAAHKAERTQVHVDYARIQCKAAEHLANVSETESKKIQQENEQALVNIKENITNLNNMIPKLNVLVCDGDNNSEDGCDLLCGGAGCGTCGESVSCQEGAKQQALSALSFANDTEKYLKEKDDAAEKFFRNISQLNTAQAKSAAQEAFDKANKLFLNFNDSARDANDVKKNIEDFINSNNSSPEEIKIVAEQVLKKDINLTKEEIQDLQKKIQEALDTLTNQDRIIAETKEDLDRVHKLKEDADKAKEKSTEIFKTAEGIKEALSNSSVAQQEANEAITNANENIDKVHHLLSKISNISEEAKNKTYETSGNIKNLSKNLTDLQNNMRNNERFAQRVIEEAVKIHQEANQTNKTAADLLDKYHNMKNILSNSSNVIEVAKVKAKELSDRAYNITHKIESTESEINKLLKGSSDQSLKDLENELESLIAQMHDYTEVIQARYNFYKSCT